MLISIWNFGPAEDDGEPTFQAGENTMSQPRPHGLGSKNWALQARKSGLTHELVSSKKLDDFSDVESPSSGELFNCEIVANRV